VSCAARASLAAAALLESVELRIPIVPYMEGGAYRCVMKTRCDSSLLMIECLDVDCGGAKKGTDIFRPTDSARNNTP